jgi:hypothetical protein
MGEVTLNMLSADSKLTKRKSTAARLGQDALLSALKIANVFE